MKNTDLTAISPLDGRYGAKVDPLRGLFSEQGLIYLRTFVEVRWVQYLAQHPGIDPRGIARGLLQGLRSGDFEGGSTLTQQLAKQGLTGDYATAFRKVVEALFALRIEALYDKEEILALYLSRVRFGHVRGIPVYGARDAARVYFGKAPARLTLAESALLVGMLKATSAYNPFDHPGHADWL